MSRPSHPSISSSPSYRAAASPRGLLPTRSQQSHALQPDGGGGHDVAASSTGASAASLAEQRASSSAPSPSSASAGSPSCAPHSASPSPNTDRTAATCIGTMADAPLPSTSSPCSSPLHAAASVSSASSSSSSSSSASSSPTSPASVPYTPRTILLTGGAGFIGSHFLTHLCLTYPHYHCICLDNLNYCASPRNFADLLPLHNFTFVQGDICSFDLVLHLLSARHIDTVLHFAAETHVDCSFDTRHSLRFTRTNVLGTHTLLEAMRVYGKVKRFIHVSTDEVYGATKDEEKGVEQEAETAKHGASETSHLKPTNPYAATKAAAELLVQSYIHSFHLPCIITRGNNVYGSRQYPEKVIPKFIQLLTHGISCPIHGTGETKRSYLYITDVINAFDIILHQGIVGEVYNIGSEIEHTTLQLLHILLDLFFIPHSPTSLRSTYIRHVPDRPYNDARYYIDTRSLERLGWKRKVGLVEGLKETIQWYRENEGHWEREETREGEEGKGKREGEMRREGRAM